MMAMKLNQQILLNQTKRVINLKNLQPGQNIALVQETKKVSINWNIDGVNNEDVDVSAYLLKKDGKVRSDEDFIFYNQPESNNKSVVLTGDGSNQQFSIDLNTIPNDIEKISFAIVIHSAGNFGQTKSLKICVEGEAEFIPVTQGMSETALILGQIYKHNGAWKFKANGAGFNGGLGPLATSFGVDVEGDPDDSSEPQSVAAVESPKPPGINLEKILEEKAPRLINLAKPAVISLKKNNVEDVKARVAFVLDCSGSMSHQFSSGNVQAVLDRIAVLAVQFDDDMAFDIWAFSDKYEKIEDVSLDNIDDYIKKLTSKGKGGFFGGSGHIVTGLGYGNNEPDVMKDVVNFYKDSDLPAYVIFVTDGGIYKDREIKKIMIPAAQYPIFWQFVGLGGSSYGVLEELDDLTGRVVDNADFFPIDDFKTVKDEDLYDRLLNEFPGWLKAAKSANIVR